MADGGGRRPELLDQQVARNRARWRGRAAGQAGPSAFAPPNERPGPRRSPRAARGGGTADKLADESAHKPCQACTCACTGGVLSLDRRLLTAPTLLASEKRLTEGSSDEHQRRQMRTGLLPPIGRDSRPDGGQTETRASRASSRARRHRRRGRGVALHRGGVDSAGLTRVRVHRRPRAVRRPPACTSGSRQPVDRAVSGSRGDAGPRCTGDGDASRQSGPDAARARGRARRTAVGATPGCGGWNGAATEALPSTAPTDARAVRAPAAVERQTSGEAKGGSRTASWLPAVAPVAAETGGPHGMSGGEGGTQGARRIRAARIRQSRDRGTRGAHPAGVLPARTHRTARSPRPAGCWSRGPRRERRGEWRRRRGRRTLRRRRWRRRVPRTTDPSARLKVVVVAEAGPAGRARRRGNPQRVR